jgi:hypothetical protein
VADACPVSQAHQSVDQSLSQLRSLRFPVTDGPVSAAKLNAYVAGRTLSDRFQIKDAVKPEKFLSPSASSIFVTKLALKTNTASLVYSTYLGGDEPGGATGIAIDGAGKVYVTGTTGFRASLAFTDNDVTHASEEVFVAKLVTPPAITGASVKGKKLTVDGKASTTAR